MLRASAPDKLRLHVHGCGACCLRESVSFLAGIDYRRDGQEIGDMDREICKRMQPPTQVSSREILRNQEITDAQLIVKRAGEPSADQTVELSISDKPCHPISASFFSDTCMKNLDRTIVDLSGNRREAISISPSFVVKEAPKS